MYLMIEIFMNILLYSVSIMFGVYMCALTLPKHILYNCEEDDLLEKEMIENCKNYMIEHMYLDEIEEFDDTSGIIDKNNVTTFDHLNNQIIMFYDPEKEMFCYYSKSDTIYKYLNVACRKYVLEHKCKQLYNDQDISKISKKENVITHNIFVNKVEHSLLEKKINKFLYCGNLEDYEKSKQTNAEYKDIDILQFISSSKTL
jgi:hypothetical protein